jgi:hypothetical protein
MSNSKNQSKEILWQLHLETKLGGNDWSISLVASEQSILTALRSMYSAFEEMLLQTLKAPGHERPAGLLDDAMLLNRCLVFNKLQEIHGRQIVLVPLGSGGRK